MRSFRLAILAVVFCGLYGCGLGWFGLPSKSVSGKVINTVQRPDGRMDALVTRSDDGGATVSTNFRVYLKITESGLNYEILQADYVYHPIVIKWKDNNHLVITIPCANIFSYTNVLNVLKNGKLDYNVSIELKNHGVCETSDGDG